MAVYALAWRLHLGRRLLRPPGPVAQIVGPLLGFALMPAMLHCCWATTLPPAPSDCPGRPPGNWWRCVAALPFAVMVSYAFGMLQYPYMPER